MPMWVPTPNSARRYIFALLSCTLQATYLLLVEQSGVKTGVGSAELLFYNALLSVPVLAAVRQPCVLVLLILHLLA